MKFFDITPVIKKSKKSRNASGGLLRLFGVALIAMGILMAGGIYSKGEWMMMSSRELAFAGFDQIEEGAALLEEKDFEGASLLFASAQRTFDAMAEDFGYLTGQSSTLLGQGLYVDIARKLLETGTEVSKIGEKAAHLLKEVPSLTQAFRTQDRSLTDLIHEQKINLDVIYKSLVKVQNNLTTIPPNTLPSKIQATLSRGQAEVALFLQALGKLNQHFDALLSLLGDKTLHRYLVLFQNNAELRATGGFIGSYALIEMKEGVIKKLEIKDVYESDGQLREKVAPPPGIDQVADRYYMRDANYDPDFPTSAKAIRWFLEKSRGPSVDTVVAVDLTVARRLLQLTGPIEMPKIGTINAENFSAVFSYLVESKASSKVTPKKVLADFIVLFKERLVATLNPLKLKGALEALAKEHHIQVHSVDPAVEQLAENLGVDGKMVAPAPKTDFFALVTTSIGGNKSDQFVVTDITHKTTINGQGGLLSSVWIKKEHEGAGDWFARLKPWVARFGTGSLTPETLQSILGAGPNLSYERVYVPKGSVLLDASGVDPKDIQAYDDASYTVFAFKMGPISSGTFKTVRLDYALPFSLSYDPLDHYRLVVQKQAGADHVRLHKSFETEEGVQVLQAYPKSESAFSLSPTYELPLTTNQFFVTSISRVF